MGNNNSWKQGTLFATKEEYFSLAISSQRTVATMTLRYMKITNIKTFYLKHNIITYQLDFLYYFVGRQVKIPVLLNDSPDLLWTKRKPWSRNYAPSISSKSTGCYRMEEPLPQISHLFDTIKAHKFRIQNFYKKKRGRTDWMKEQESFHTSNTTTTRHLSRWSLV